MAKLGEAKKCNQKTPVQFVEAFQHRVLYRSCKQKQYFSWYNIKARPGPKKLLQNNMREKQLLVPAVGAGALMDSTVVLEGAKERSGGYRMCKTLQSLPRFVPPNPIFQITTTHTQMKSLPFLHSWSRRGKSAVTQGAAPHSQTCSSPGHDWTVTSNCDLGLSNFQHKKYIGQVPVALEVWCRTLAHNSTRLEDLCWGNFQCFLRLAAHSSYNPKKGGRGCCRKIPLL